MAAVKIAQIGLGGYAGVHTRSIQGLVKEGLAEFVAAADPFVEQNADRIEALTSQGVKHYTDYSEMLEAEKPEAVTIGTPIPFHTEMILAALERGCHVLIEKPPVVLIQDLDRVAAEAASRNLLVQTGFQNVVDAPAQDLKASLLAGKFGAVQHVTVLGLWQRLDSYYARASWAGKIKLGERWALDGPINNPLIHYMHEGLFFAGAALAATAQPLRVQAEIYRAHAIEGEDTVCMRSWLKGGAEMRIYLTLCAPESQPATVKVECEHASIVWQQGNVRIQASGHEARVEQPGQDLSLTNFRNFARAITEGEPQMNPLSASRNIILENNGAYLSSGAIHTIPASHLKRYDLSDSVATDIVGVKELIDDASEQRKLFSEMGVPWAKSGRVVELDFVEFDPSFLLG